MSDKDKLIAILEGLEVENISGFMEKAEVSDYKYMGMMIAKAQKQKAKDLYDYPKMFNCLKGVVSEIKNLDDMSKCGTIHQIEKLESNPVVEFILQEIEARR